MINCGRDKISLVKIGLTRNEFGKTRDQINLARE